MTDTLYCFTSKQQENFKDGNIIICANGRRRMEGLCLICNKKHSKFIKNENTTNENTTNEIKKKVPTENTTKEIKKKVPKEKKRKNAIVPIETVEVTTN